MLLKKESNPSKEVTDNRVLVVEDEQMARVIARYLLSDLGYVVDFAQSQREVGELTAQASYTFVLMDIDLPDGENGYDITSFMIADPSYRGLPIIGLTAHTNQAVYDCAKRVGMLECYSKPLTRELIQEIISQHVNLTRPYYQTNARSVESAVAG